MQADRAPAQLDEAPADRQAQAQPAIAYAACTRAGCALTASRTRPVRSPLHTAPDERRRESAPHVRRLHRLRPRLHGA
jgi:hypothetical protein